MKKIEQDMVKAWNENRPWQGNNTTVAVEWDSTINEPVTRVILFGHTIAKKWVSDYGGSYCSWTLAGWNTQTTRSRLRALGVKLESRKGKVYVWGKPISGLKDWHEWPSAE